MKSEFKKGIRIVFWVVIPGLFFFIYFLFKEWDSLSSVLGKNPGFNLLLISTILMVILGFVFRNLEQIIITFFSTVLSILVTAGVHLFFDLNNNSLILWSAIYGFNLIIGILIMWDIHHRKRGEKWQSNTGLQYLSLVVLISGFLLLAISDSIVTDYFGFMLIVFASTYIYVICFQKVIYNNFFSKRISRGMGQLTFFNIIQTLWTYFILVGGSVILGTVGGLLFALIFIRLEKRKTIFHYIIMYYSRFFIWIIPIKPKKINEPAENFIKPSVIICSHKSLIDTAIMFSLYPKTIILTNDWVYNSPIFGLVSRYADFYTVSSGIDQIMEKLRERIEKGYSIIVFPEGTRSLTHKIQRFHRGAFYIAEELKLDIVPILIYGSGEFLKKGEFWGKRSRIVQKIFPRIGITDTTFGESYSRRAKLIRQYLSREYEKLMEETP